MVTGYLNKWVSSKQITKLIMLWTNATKEAIRLGGLKKLILQNNDKSSKMHYKLIVINGVYATRHATHSYINSMRNIIILILRRSV